jgi:hypothetical protein
VNMDLPSLKDLVSIVQILFYITGGTVAILTFLSAKKGFLNTVNTEYHKRSMDHLESLSKRLYEEFDNTSDKYWSNHTHKRHTYFEEIVDGYQNQEEQEENPFFHPGTPIDPIIDRLENLIKSCKSEPFLPEIITSRVLSGLEPKVNDLAAIFYEGVPRFKEDLAKGKYDKNLAMAPGIFSNDLNREMYEKGCGISQIEEEVHMIRLYIRNYLRSFDPIKRKG